MNTELRKNPKNNFEKDFYKLMNNAVFGKTMENVGKYRDIKLVTKKKKRCKLASKPNYHTPKWFSKEFLAMEMKKTKVKINKPIYLSFSILEVSKTLMYEFLYDQMKPKYVEQAKLCDTAHIALSFILKQKIFMNILHLILINGLILLGM